MTNEQVIEKILTIQRDLAQMEGKLSASQKRTLQTAIQSLTVLIAETEVEEPAQPSSVIQEDSPVLADDYQHLWTSSTDYVYTVHINGGRSLSTTHGPGCAAVTGYTAQEYANDPYLWFHMIFKDDRKMVLEQASRAVAGKEPHAVEHRILHKNGSLRWIRNAPVPRYDQSGRLIAYDGLITDITERRKNEDAVRENEEKYRTLFEASLDSIFVESLEGGILDCNTAACKMLGYSKAELLQLSVSDLLPQGVTFNLQSVISSELANGGITLETTNRRKDGSLFPCDVSTRMIKVNGEGRVIAFVHDLTERKLAEQVRLRQIEAEARAASAETARLNLEKEAFERKKIEAALQESEKRYRTLVETSPDAIFYLSHDLHILFCNQCAAELYGVNDPNEVLGMSALNLLGPENHSWILDEITRFSKGWSARGLEFTLQKVDGSQFPAEVGVSLVFNERDEHIGIICIVRDITQRKQMEQFVVRTERLAAMGKMSAELAHEIKNPLQSIQSNLELVLNYALDPSESQEHLRMCYRELERLVTLSNQLLNQANPHPSDSQRVSVSDLFQRTMVLLEKSSRDSGINIHLVVPDEFPTLRVKPDELMQVLLNLSINAIEAMPNGGQFTMSAEASDEWIQLNVINDGNITPANRLDNIFELFYTTKIGGTGLGLPISYNIVRKMGGSLSAANLHDPDRVKFTISFPVAQVVYGKRFDLEDYPNGSEGLI